MVDGLLRNGCLAVGMIVCGCFVVVGLGVWLWVWVFRDCGMLFVSVSIFCGFFFKKKIIWWVDNVYIILNKFYVKIRDKSYDVLLSVVLKKI